MLFSALATASISVRSNGPISQNIYARQTRSGTTAGKHVKKPSGIQSGRFFIGNHRTVPRFLSEGFYREPQNRPLVPSAQLISATDSPATSSPFITKRCIRVVLGFSIRCMSFSAATLPIFAVSCLKVVSLGLMICDI